MGRKCEVWWNGGAYADIGPRVTQKSGFTAAGPYDIENIDIDSFALYTNRPPAGALRGFGIPQLVWAYESHTDIIARELGIDPIDFRKRNILRNGRPQAVGTIIEDGEFEQVLDETARRLSWSRPIDRGVWQSVSRHRSRRPRPALSSASMLTAALSFIAALSTWGRARIRRWRKSLQRCSIFRLR